MFKSKIYRYNFNDLSSKELLNKIRYSGKISKDVDVIFENDDIIIKNKNVGRKNTSAFVGKIIEKNKGCCLEGSFPDEKNNNIMLLFFGIWYFMFVFFTFGKMTPTQSAIYYVLGFVFLSGLAYVIYFTQKKSFAAVRKFIDELKVTK